MTLDGEPFCDEKQPGDLFSMGLSSSFGPPTPDSVDESSVVKVKKMMPLRMESLKKVDGACHEGSSLQALPSRPLKIHENVNIRLIRPPHPLLKVSDLEMCRLTGDDDKDTKDSEEQVTPAISEDGSVSRAEDVFFALSLEGLGKYPEGLSCFVDGKEVNDEEPKEKEKPSEEEPKAIFVFARSSFLRQFFF